MLMIFYIHILFLYLTMSQTLGLIFHELTKSSSSYRNYHSYHEGPLTHRATNAHADAIIKLSRKIYPEDIYEKLHDFATGYRDHQMDRLLNNKRTPRKVLDWYWKNGSEWHRYCIVKNPKCPIKYLKKFVDNNPKDSWKLSHNVRHLSSEILEYIYDKYGINYEIGLCSRNLLKNPNLGKRLYYVMLDRFIYEKPHSDGVDGLEEIANHPECPLDILELFRYSISFDKIFPDLNQISDICKSGKITQTIDLTSKISKVYVRETRNKWTKTYKPDKRSSRKLSNIRDLMNHPQVTIQIPCWSITSGSEFEQQEYNSIVAKIKEMYGKAK